MLDTINVYTLADFMSDHETHMARLKETKAPEVLTVHGRPEAVMLDPDSYQNLIDRVKHLEAVASIRADFARARKTAPAAAAITQEELERRRNVMRELMAETERLGLY